MPHSKTQNAKLKAGELKQMNLLVPSDILEEWKRSARASGLSLTQWVTFRCRGIILVDTSKAG